MQKPCTGTRRNGRPCKAPARANGLCWFHDPAVAAERDAARVAGGHAKSNAARVQAYMPDSLKPVLAKLIAALDETHEGALAPSQAQALASLAGAIGKLYEVAQLEAKIEQIEAKAQQQATQPMGGRTRWPA
jgi:hypothetical protein